MPNPNISAVLASADKTTIKANIDANKVFIDVFGVNLTQQQRKSEAKMGPDSVSFVQDCLLAGQNHPTVVPGDMVITEFEKDVNLFSDMNELEIHHDPYVELISDTKMAVGTEAYRQALRIYANVKEQAKHDSALQSVYNQLSARFANLKGSRPRQAVQALVLPPSGSVAVINVVEGSPVKNTGSADIMLCNGTLPVCTSGTLLKPNETVNLVLGVTSVTITNQSSVLNGSFTVKTSS